MQHCPIQDILGGIIRAVVASPSRHAQKVSSLVEIVVEKLDAGV
jgi:hypothetical protein